MTTMTSILAQIVAGYSIPQLAIFFIIACAVIGIALVAIRQSGVQIPPFVVTILWILAVAVFAILCIKFLVGMV